MVWKEIEKEEGKEDRHVRQFLPSLLVTETSVLLKPEMQETSSLESSGCLESMNFQLIRFCDLDFSEKLDDVIPLISLQLNYLSILRMFNDCSITSELLKKGTLKR